MRKRTRGLVLTAGLLLGLAPQAVRAQAYVPPATSPFPKPPVSPYLNLFRGGPPGINYYGLVRPQEQTGTALWQLQQRQQQLAAGQVALVTGDPNLPSTGHPTRFFNYSHYFLNQGGATAAAGTAGYVPLGATVPLAAGYPPAPAVGVGTGRALR